MVSVAVRVGLLLPELVEEPNDSIVTVSLVAADSLADDLVLRAVPVNPNPAPYCVDVSPVVVCGVEE